MIDKFEEYWRRAEPGITEKTKMNGRAVKNIAVCAYLQGRQDCKKENEPFITIDDIVDIRTALEIQNIRKDIIERVAIHVSRENYKELFSWADIKVVTDPDGNKIHWSGRAPYGLLDGMRIIIDD